MSRGLAPTVEVGHTYTIRNERGELFIGWADTLDGAIADAMHRMNERTAARLRVAVLINEFNGSKERT